MQGKEEEIMALDDTIKTFDINKELNIFNLRAKQNDTTGARSFTFRLIKNNQIFDLTGLTIKVGGNKADGKQIFNNCKIINASKGLVELELTTQMLTTAGTLNLELIILQGEIRLSTIPFEVEIIPSVTKYSDIVSSDEYGALIDSLNKADEYGQKLQEGTEKIELQYANKLNEVSSQLSENETKINNFTYDNTDIPLIGQGVPTDVNMLMKKKFSNDKREFAFGIEIDADGSTGSHDPKVASGHKVAMYSSAYTGETGKPYIWAFNTLTQVDKGLKNKTIAQGYELDINNNQGDEYEVFDWDQGVILGLNVTSGGDYPISSGIRVGSTNDKNAPYYGIYLDASKKNAIKIAGKHLYGVDTANAEIETKYAFTLNDTQKFGVYHFDTDQVTTFLRFIKKYIVINTQGEGFMITTKDEKKVLFEVKENGEVIIPETLKTKRLEAPVITNGQGEIRPVLSGNSTSMPTNPLIGQMYFDRTRGIPLFWNGVGWVKADGNLPS